MIKAKGRKQQEGDRSFAKRKLTKMGEGLLPDLDVIREDE